MVARLLTPAELVHKLDALVIGQREAKQQLAMAVYRHYLGLRLRQQGGAAGQDLGPQHQLLLGPTGVGKSHLVKSIAALLGVPTAFTACTSLVETGYVGTPVESVFFSLLDRADGDPRLAECGIVFLDEFDKLRRAPDVGRDVSGEGVQNGLLTLMDGRPVRLRYRDREVTLDSAKVLFLCTGAFSGLVPIVRRRLARDHAALGFTGGSRARDDAGNAEWLARATPEDLIEFGIIPELVGRFAGIVALHALTHADLERVLSDAQHSPLRAKERLFELHGIRLEVAADVRHVLVERAVAQGLGARALHRVVAEAFADLEFQLPRLAAQGVGAVRMTLAAVDGNGTPILIHRRDLRDWKPPQPSADDLRHGPPRPRTDPQAKPQREAPGRRPREASQPPQNPSPDGPTLFEPGS
jgi:ATP-dependent Clp protease ATP-binding subunit ClpX